MNTRQLEVFWAVMRTGSVTAAAKLLHVSGPAVSRVLTHLEQSIRFPLFDRIKGRLHPTSEALRLMESVNSVYGDIQGIEILIKDLAQRKQGLLSVASSPGIGQELIPRAIVRLQRQQPGLRIRFLCLNHEPLKDQLLQGRYDLGVSTLPMNHPQLTSQLVARSELVCICPWSHPLAEQDGASADELKRFPFIGYLPDTPMAARLKEFFEDSGGEPAAFMEVGSPQNACTLVAQGAGIALVEEFSLQAWPKASFRIIPLEGTRQIVANLVYMHGAPLSRTAVAFIDCLEDVLDECGLGVKGKPPLAPRLELKHAQA